MGFLDSIRDRLRGGSDDDYYEDDYYDEGYEDDGYSGAQEPRRRDVGSSPRLLGNTPRPEAESVSVYTRSGRPVSAERPASAASRPAPSTYAAPSPVEPSYQPSYHSDATSVMRPTSSATPGDVGLKPVSRVSSGKLPPYVLKPVSYDDVQTVVRRVRTNQPVVIVFRNTNIETAKRILDFCFGLSFGLGGEVRELGDRVFVVLPADVDLSQSDLDKLVADGDLVR
ncbi:cell division protein SepF [Thermophilibacter provencensis]|uniref:Cell division protein SepF n=1 Tax=Thermophilibacter provencensis TaxID=1852386 RepID=A0A921GF97_9ACTN|nr:cell division protein SepF [Thermophilibacter provencensis]HJF45216.1 cell division protein SepF [Thermophilibacter provencensis]